MAWTVEETGFDKKNIELFGSKFLLGNGYMGYRGTLEEFKSAELCACTLANCYDKSGTHWREPVNLPNPFRVLATVDGAALDVLQSPVKSHCQKLDLFRALHIRKTEFITKSGVVSVQSERFLSRDDIHLMAMRYRVEADFDGELSAEFLLDDDIWDIGGPHLLRAAYERMGGALVYHAQTAERGERIAVAQAVTAKTAIVEQSRGGFAAVPLRANQPVEFTIYAAVAREEETADCEKRAAELAVKAQKLGFGALRAAHEAVWQNIWKDADVVVEGDEQADLALRYSLYLLMCSAPFHTDKVVVAARGLSGQIYKGAMFWDTEIYMLPFFSHSLPAVGRNLIMYRINTLDGARRKAREYGYGGAFYAWESQETGDEMCTEYAINDVLTGRPIRTYFRDKQIHISADVMFGIWQYVRASGDESVLLDGGLETMLECARFLYQYSVYRPVKERYEFYDVTSPDEYHERVNNDAYTNLMTKAMVEKTLHLLKTQRDLHPEKVKNILKSILLDDKELQKLAEFSQRLYQPLPGRDGVVEQFDGYFAREDAAVSEITARKLHENEYLGGPCGVATQTQIIKQADVVLAAALLPERFTEEEKLSNWRYYEPRTEHGSSLSACIYALVAARCDLKEEAYRYFLKTAMVDLTGDYKLYVGDLYIGGTHTAANGGAWMVTVLGFAGFSASDSGVAFAPHLPKGWKSVTFHFYRAERGYTATVSNQKITIKADGENAAPVLVTAFGKSAPLCGGEEVSIKA